MRVDEFDYDLPEDLIAQTPLQDRAGSRLLVVDPQTCALDHAHFHEIGRFLQPGDVLVMNNSKVLPARLFGFKADTGGRIELLLLKPLPAGEWQCLCKPARRLRCGQRIRFEEGTEAEVTAEFDEGIRNIRFHIDAGEMSGFLDRVGTMPLPPYIRAPLSERDRYQTVYADPPGSVAAPTAGLHFTAALLEQLSRQGVELHVVTLHVGLGTFRPVQVDSVEAHRMHTEWYRVPPETATAVNRARQTGRRVIAVGTTALRTLESASASGVVEAGTAETDIFIYPGYSFRTVDALITNFHLPKSTLIMLIAAFAGLTCTRVAYETAVGDRYRFFSFGDAMFITRRQST